MKYRYYLLLQLGVEIDQKIAAGDQIKLGEGGILHHALLCENQHLPDVFPDEETIVPGGEETA